MLRHAQSEANRAGFLAGRLEDIPLSKNGINEREKLTRRLEGSKFDLIVSSPIERCIETINPYLDISKQGLILESGFIEVDYGVFTGRKFSNLRKDSNWRETLSAGKKAKFKDGESISQVSRRTIETLNSYGKAKRKNILISTHADVVKIAIFHALGVAISDLDRIQIDNTSITIIDIEDDKYTLHKVNDLHSKIKEFLL